MIFATVGGQLGFDRLIRTVDEWAGETGREDVFCQILDGEYEPKNTLWERSLTAGAFHERLLDARLIIAHAGMGTIITALEHAKPIVVMPRQAALHEQRNDHQLATAGRFKERNQVIVAMDESELRTNLDRVDDIVASPAISDRASDELLDAIRSFIRP